MNEEINYLYSEYPGDSKWEAYASLASNEKVSDLIKKFPSMDDKILQVIRVKLGVRALEWLSEPNPAIAGMSPEELAKIDTGTEMLKTLLMRMP